MIFNDVKALRSSGFKPQVCIVGSGPAGMSLALRLQSKAIPCLIVEAGGETYTPQSQDAYRGKVIGDSYFELHTARLRHLGGSSGHWEGWCRGLDVIDFEPRAGVPNSGWPIRKADLDPYEQATAEILDVGKTEADAALSADLKEVYFSFSDPPVHFGTKYKKMLQDSSRIGLLLNAPVVDIVPQGGRIASVSVKADEGKVWPLNAPFYCLCTGGIENSRLLLWANALHQGGVVPNPKTLGKYWMEHPAFVIGEAVILQEPAIAKKMGLRFYGPTSAALNRLAIGNFAVRLGVESRNIKRLIKSGMCVAPDFFNNAMLKYNARLACGAGVKLAWEQVPVESNRIELDEERDAVGMARAKLFWKKSPIEMKTAQHAARLFGEHLIRSDWGRLKVAPWVLQGTSYPTHEGGAGFHHMGGTRMANMPSEGVVDTNGKVFGVENLFVAGSSVFPSAGHTNPTYAIVQLALRLGDHLAQRMSAT